MPTGAPAASLRGILEGICEGPAFAFLALAPKVGSQEPFRTLNNGSTVVFLLPQGVEPSKGPLENLKALRQERSPRNSWTKASEQ